MVVAIIGILASLLLPALGKARKKSQQVVCKSNLKQLGTALTMYLDDNASDFPYSEGHLSFDDLLAGYDGRRGLIQAEKAENGLSKTTYPSLGSNLYICPNYDTTRDDSDVKYRRSYSMPGNNTNQNDFSGVYGKAERFIRNINEVNSSSLVLSFVELHSSTNYLGKSANSYAKPAQLDSDDAHFQKSNYAFVDGHVESLSFYATIQTSLGIDVNNVTGSMWDATR